MRLDLVADILEVVRAGAGAEPFGGAHGTLGKAAPVEGFVCEREAVGIAACFKRVETGGVTLAVRGDLDGTATA